MSIPMEFVVSVVMAVSMVFVLPVVMSVPMVSVSCSVVGGAVGIGTNSNDRIPMCGLR